MTDPTPHALGFTWELENRLAVAQGRVVDLNSIVATAQPTAIEMYRGRVRAQEWLVKTIKQALARDAPRGDE